MIRSLIISMMVVLLNDPVNQPAPQQTFYVTSQQLTCLANNIYFEGRGESNTGKKAIAYVTLNRVVDDNFPSTICDVVKQGLNDSNGNLLKHRCQFSWWCDGKKEVIHNWKLWDLCYTIAGNVIESYSFTNDPTQGSTYYHSTKSNPKWSKYFKRIVRIDNHVFYKDQ